MPESYLVPPDGSSPTLPELPRQSPARFQFGMKLLLGLMLGSTVFASAAHYGVMYFQRVNRQLPAYHQPILVAEAIVFSILLGAWFYFFVRVPYLARDAGSFHRRWTMLRKHRHDLAAWSDERRRQHRVKPVADDAPPPSG